MSNLEPLFVSVMERSIARFIGGADVRPVDQSGSDVWQQEYGIARSAATRSLPGHTTLNLKSYNARIKLSATSKRKAAGICQALAPDVTVTPLSGTRAEIFLENYEVTLKIETNDIASIRATINSYLRLAEASYKCLSL